MNTHEDPHDDESKTPSARLPTDASSRTPHRKRVPDRERVDFDTWFKKGRDFTLEGMFDAVRTEDLANADNLLRLGRRQLELMFTAWAIPTLRLYCEVRPRDKEGVALLAEALAKDPMTDNATAVKALRDAIRLDPNNADCHADLAYALQDQGKTAAAIKSYERAFELGCDDEHAWFRAANLYLIDDQPRKAQALLQKVEPKVEDRAMLIELLAECRRKIEGEKG